MVLTQSRLLLSIHGDEVFTGIKLSFSDPRPQCTRVPLLCHSQETKHTGICYVLHYVLCLSGKYMARQWTKEEQRCLEGLSDSGGKGAGLRREGWLCTSAKRLPYLHSVCGRKGRNSQVFTLSFESSPPPYPAV